MTQEHHEEHRPFADAGEVIASLNAIREQVAALDRRNTEQMHRIELKTEESAFHVETKTDAMDARNTRSLARIEEQVSKTNGRVSKLELRNAFLSGGLALLALGFAGGVAWIGLLK